MYWYRNFIEKKLRHTVMGLGGGWGLGMLNYSISLEQKWFKFGTKCVIIGRTVIKICPKHTNIWKKKETLERRVILMHRFDYFSTNYSALVLFPPHWRSFFYRQFFFNFINLLEFCIVNNIPPLRTVVIASQTRSWYVLMWRVCGCGGALGGALRISFRSPF